MTEFSLDAQRICARFFPTVGSNVCSHPPHDTLAQYGDGMCELVDAGAVTTRPRNDRGSVEYHATQVAVDAGQAVRRRSMADALGIKLPEDS